MVLEPEGTLKMRLQIHFKDQTEVNSPSVVTELGLHSSNVLRSVSVITELINHLFTLNIELFIQRLYILLNISLFSYME